jgi:hypothetical protein
MWGTRHPAALKGESKKQIPFGNDNKENKDKNKSTGKATIRPRGEKPVLEQNQDNRALNNCIQGADFLRKSAL